MTQSDETNNRTDGTPSGEGSEPEGTERELRGGSTRVGYGREPGQVASMVDTSAVRRVADRLVGDITLPEAPFLEGTPSLRDIQEHSAMGVTESGESGAPAPDKSPAAEGPDHAPHPAGTHAGNDSLTQSSASMQSTAAATGGQAGTGQQPVADTQESATGPVQQARGKDSPNGEHRRLQSSSMVIDAEPPPLGSIPDVPEIPVQPRGRERKVSLWDSIEDVPKEPAPLGPVPRADSGEDSDSWDILEDSPVGSLPPLGQVLQDSGEQRGKEDDTTKVKTHRIRAMDMSDLFTSPGEATGLKGIFRLSSQSLPVLDDSPSDSSNHARLSLDQGGDKPQETEDEEPTVVWSTRGNDKTAPSETPATDEDDPGLIALEETVLSHPSQESMLPDEPAAKRKRGAAQRADTTKWSRDDVIAGKYQVEERIGSGGMAKIFRVVHRDLGKPFALKIIHSSLSEDPSVREMFYREARLASSMDHPNVVQVTDFGEDPRFGAFIVMEYLQGETLHARLNREGAIKVSTACEVVLQVAEALHFIHSRDVVHCDIKSENIFLVDTTTSGRRRTQVKLLDFGLSAALTASSPDAAPSAKIGGTPAYMAPERIRREPPTPRTDIYALGVLFYEIITASLPFSGDMEQALMGHLYEEPSPPSTRAPFPVDERIDELILKALSKDPQDRQKDMGAFIFELRTAMHMLGINTGRHRAVAGRAMSLRANRCETVFDEAPVPLFQVQPDGVITLANEAFAKFLNLPGNSLVGANIMDTKLGKLCPELAQDILRVTQHSVPVQRLIIFPFTGQHHPAPNQRRQETPPSVLVWLTPHAPDDKVESVTGVIHPYSH